MLIFTYSCKSKVELPSFPRPQQVGATATRASSCRRGSTAFPHLSQRFLLSLLYFHDWVVFFLKENQTPKRITTNSTTLTVIFSMWGQPESPWGLHVEPKKPKVLNFPLQSSALQISHTQKSTQQENFEPICSILCRSGHHHVKCS